MIFGFNSNQKRLRQDEDSGFYYNEISFNSNQKRLRHGLLDVDARDIAVSTPTRSD